jgi:hypothetical protein
MDFAKHKHSSLFCCRISDEENRFITLKNRVKVYQPLFSKPLTMSTKSLFQTLASTNTLAYFDEKKVS